MRGKRHSLKNKRKRIREINFDYFRLISSDTLFLIILQ